MPISGISHNIIFKGAIPNDQLHIYPPEDSRLEAAGIGELAYWIPYHDLYVLKYIKKIPIHYRYTKKQAKVLLHSLYCKYFPESFWKVKIVRFSLHNCLTINC